VFITVVEAVNVAPLATLLGAERLALNVGGLACDIPSMAIA
jgi:hypothetical protein